jgi:hypothetical protein
MSRSNGIVKYLVDISEIMVDLSVEVEKLVLKHCRFVYSNFGKAKPRLTYNGCSNQQKAK